ncbi:hypothetical protein Y032_0183g914 [Ancylostoma ceylanicum]|uniref:EGF-like domain-containing protein n=1 Tax=Ancylostoma ceylanicum TaxID=53326 RepID=A0A016SRY1_9BILA|nr:hypothetical protein Y032_0183g914 [Ancylostoma ceylanicum]
MYLRSGQLDKQHPWMPCKKEGSSWVSPESANVLHFWMSLESAGSSRARTTMRGCTYGTGLVSEPSIPPEQRKCFNISFVWVKKLCEKPTTALENCKGNTDEKRINELVEDATALCPVPNTGYNGLCPCTCSELCENFFFVSAQCPEGSDYNFMRSRASTVRLTEPPSIKAEITTTQKNKLTTLVSSSASTAAIVQILTTTERGEQQLAAYETTTLMRQPLPQDRVTFPASDDKKLTSTAIDSGVATTLTHGSTSGFIESAQSDRTVVIGYGPDESSQHTVEDSTSGSTEYAQRDQTSISSYVTDQSFHQSTGKSRSETYDMGTSSKITYTPLSFKTSREAIATTSTLASPPSSEDVPTADHSYSPHSPTNSRGDSETTSLAITAGTSTTENTREESSGTRLLFGSTEQNGGQASTWSTAPTEENTIFSETPASLDVKTSVSSESSITSRDNTRGSMDPTKLGENSGRASSTKITEYSQSPTVPNAHHSTGLKPTPKEPKGTTLTEAHHLTRVTEKGVDDSSPSREMSTISMASRQSSLIKLISSTGSRSSSEVTALTDVTLSSHRPPYLTTRTTRSYVSEASNPAADGTTAEDAQSSVILDHTSQEVMAASMASYSATGMTPLLSTAPHTMTASSSITSATTSPNAPYSSRSETETDNCSTTKEDYEGTQTSMVSREWTQNGTSHSTLRHSPEDITTPSTPESVHGPEDSTIHSTPESILNSTQLRTNTIEPTSTATSASSTTSSISTVVLGSSTSSPFVVRMSTNRTPLEHTTTEHRKTTEITHRNLSGLQTTTEVVLATSSAAKMTVTEAENPDQTSSAIVGEAETSLRTASESFGVITTTSLPITYVNSKTTSWPARSTSPITASISATFSVSQSEKASSLTKTSEQETYFPSRGTSITAKIPIQFTVSSPSVATTPALKEEPQKQSIAVESSSSPLDLVGTVPDDAVPTVSSTAFTITPTTKYSSTLLSENESGDELIFSTTSASQEMSHDGGITITPATKYSSTLLSENESVDELILTATSESQEMSHDGGISITPATKYSSTLLSGNENVDELIFSTTSESQEMSRDRGISITPTTKYSSPLSSENESSGELIFSTTSATQEMGHDGRISTIPATKNNSPLPSESENSNKLIFSTTLESQEIGHDGGVRITPATKYSSPLLSENENSNELIFFTTSESQEMDHDGGISITPETRYSSPLLSENESSDEQILSTTSESQEMDQDGGISITPATKNSSPLLSENESIDELIFSTTSKSQEMGHDGGVSNSLNYCAMPCPTGYREGPAFCYNIVPIAMSTTYRRALSYCQTDDNADIAREQDFLDEDVVTIVRHLRMQENVLTTRFYVKERTFENRGKVRLVDVMDANGSILDINATVGVSEVHHDIAALCRRAKHCNPLFCDLGDFHYFQKVTDLVLPTESTIMKIGESFEIPWCAHSNGSDRITFTCEERGDIRPHPTAITCEKEATEDIEDVDTPWNQKVQTTCGSCYSLGTAKCLAVPDGYTCSCKPGWSGFRCWRAPDMCELQNFTCGTNGTCVTEVDKAYCSCEKEFGGSHCEVLKSSLFAHGNNRSFVLTPPVTSDLILTTTETTVTIGKAVLLFHLPRSKIDPQESYQEFRTIFLMFAGYLFLFLHHPAILALTYWKCTLAWYSTAVFFSLAVFTYILEAINANETITGKQRNIWAFDISGKSSWYFGQTYRLACAFAAVGGIVVAIGYTSSTLLVSAWTCMGIYSVTSSDLWLPILCLNFIFALSATAYSYESMFIQKYLPHYGERIEKYVEQLDDRGRNDLLKCQSSIYFTCIGPWLLGGLWILQTASCYFVTDVYINGLMLTFSCLRSLCSILHSAFTAPMVLLFSAQIDTLHLKMYSLLAGVQ